MIWEGPLKGAVSSKKTIDIRRGLVQNGQNEPGVTNPVATDRKTRTRQNIK